MKYMIVIKKKFVQASLEFLKLPQEKKKKNLLQKKLFSNNLRFVTQTNSVFNA